MTFYRSATLKSLLLRSLLISGLALFIAPLALSQGAVPAGSGGETYSPSMTFDVASIRESKPDLTGMFMVGGAFAGSTGSLRLSNERIGNIIRKAYGLTSQTRLELPDWISGATFNVEAKSNDATNKKLATLTVEQVALEQQHMLQALLAERFNLKVHCRTKESAVYNLVLAKGGPKVHSGGSLPTSDEDRKRLGGNKLPEIFQRGDNTHGYEYIGRNCHIASLTRILEGLMGTAVIDRSGLGSTYDFDLRYSQATDAQRDNDPNVFPPVPEAVEKQLGLKLERAKGQIRELVIDHIDRLSAN